MESKSSQMMLWIVLLVAVHFGNAGVPAPAPADTTAAPADTTAAPAETTAAPAETTAAPAETTEAPAETTEAPAETTEAPAETTAAPAETTEAPAETTEAPAETTEAPAETTEAPAETTAAPAETTAAPAETTEAPAETTEAPATPTPAPATPTPAPATPTPAPATPTPAPDAGLKCYSCDTTAEDCPLEGLDTDNTSVITCSRSCKLIVKGENVTRGCAGDECGAEAVVKRADGAVLHCCARDLCNESPIEVDCTLDPSAPGCNSGAGRPRMALLSWLLIPLTTLTALTSSLI